MNIKTEWAKLSVKWQWRLFVIGLFLLFIVAYQFNIKKTISVFNEYTVLKHTADTIPKESVIANYLTELNKPILNENGTNRISLLKHISSFCADSDIKIIELNQTYSQKNNYMIETNKILLCGPYYKTLSLVSNLENSHTAGISSVYWDLTKDMDEGRYFLLATLYIKYIVYENKS